jgi:hypothetical protein
LFGTNLTAGGAAVVLILGTMTGAFKALFAVLRTGVALFNALRLAALALGVGFAPFLAIVIAVTAALYLLMQVDWVSFGQRASAALQAVIGFFTGLKDGAVSAIQAIIDYFARFIENVKLIASQPGAAFAVTWEMIKAGAQAVVDFVIMVWDTVVAWFLALPDKLANIWTAISQAIKDAFNSAVEAVKKYFADLYASAMKYLKPIVDLIKAISSAGGEGFASGGTVRAATGGHITGPGTGTSDSILARLSNGEFVMKAAAVRNYGTDFMHRINQGRLNFPAFASGGLVSPSPSLIPSLNDAGNPGGGGMTPLSLTLFGETFENLMMPEDVAGRMTRFAIAKQNKSAGRKPDWVGRGRR